MVRNLSTLPTMSHISIVREPATPPDIPAPPISRPLNREILFRHPGYNNSNNIMLKLFAPDTQDNTHGLYARFALDACGVIAGNRWDGWLSRSKDPTALKEDPITILQEASYYFHLPDSSSDVPYPVVPNFAQWRFPHNDGPQLPDAWRQLDLGRNPVQHSARSDFSAAVRIRDLSCRITGCRVAAQVAHLCPQKEYDWINQNAMHQYNLLGEPGPNDLSNMLLLRADLHLEFDNKKFVFVPKPLSSPQNQHHLPHHPQLVTHILKPEAELEHLYHNRKLQFSQGDGPSVEWLFARFAWSIFPFLNGFLTNKVPRRLRLYDENGDAVDDYFSVNDCVGFSTAPNAPKSRSQSPKKRQRPQASGDGIREGDLGTKDEDESRSRKRLRHGQNLSSESHSPHRVHPQYRCLATQPQLSVKHQKTHLASHQNNRNCSRHHQIQAHPKNRDDYSEQYLLGSQLPVPISNTTISPTPPSQGQDRSKSLHDLPQKSLSGIDSFPKGENPNILGSTFSPQDSAHTSLTYDHDYDSNATHQTPPLEHVANYSHAICLTPQTDVNASPSRSALAAAWLSKDRARVDPLQLKQWEEDQRWAKEVWNGKITLDEKSARKWYELSGAEVMD